jgi:hypothetical protein
MCETFPPNQREACDIPRASIKVGSENRLQYFSGSLKMTFASSSPLSPARQSLTAEPTRPFQASKKGRARAVSAVGSAGSATLYDEAASGPVHRLLESVLQETGGAPAVLGLVKGYARAGKGFDGLMHQALQHTAVVRPMRRLTANMVAFRANPENPARIIAASERTDEIGTAERELAAMQAALAALLAEKNHLAALGLAVSKINHDLRNLLTSAQLFSERLAKVADPHVQRFAPQLMRALEATRASAARALPLRARAAAPAYPSPAAAPDPQFAKTEFAPRARRHAKMGTESRKEMESQSSVRKGGVIPIPGGGGVGSGGVEEEL